MGVEQLYKEYLTNKTVCLVGGGSTYDAAKVNSQYDIIARVGSHLNEQTDLLHDVLYHSGSDPENVIPDLTIVPHWTDFIVTNSLKPQSIKKFKDTGIKTRTIVMNCLPHKERLEPFCTELGCDYAFTGFFAINDLLSFPIDNLYLTGMDLNPKNLGNHDKEKHANWLRNKMKEDPRIKLDFTLEKIIL